MRPRGPTWLSTSHLRANDAKTTPNGDQRGAGRRLLIPETRVQTDKNAPVDFLLMQRSPGEWRESRRGRGAFPPGRGKKPFAGYAASSSEKGGTCSVFVRVARECEGFLFA